MADDSRDDDHDESEAAQWFVVALVFVLSTGIRSASDVGFWPGLAISVAIAAAAGWAFRVWRRRRTRRV